MLILDPRCEFMSEQLTCLSTPSCGNFSFPWNKGKQNIRGFSVSVYSKRFQKIKQSVDIPFRKTSSISSHGRLSNWNDASDDKSICVSVCERPLGTKVIGSQTCSQMHNMSNPLVCICVNWCNIQDFKLYEWFLFTCTVHIHIKLMNKISVTQHGIEKCDQLILYQYNYL